MKGCAQTEEKLEETAVVCSQSAERKQFCKLLSKEIK